MFYYKIDTKISVQSVSQKERLTQVNWQRKMTFLILFLFHYLV